MAYPVSIDSPGGTAAQGTTLLSSVDHALDHRTLGSAVIAIETKVGIGSGTPTANSFFVGLGSGTSGWNNSGTNLTFNNSTFNNGTLGTPTINNSTLGTFVASGLYQNGTVSGNGTINWANGDRQVYTISANGTIAFSNAKSGQILTLEILQNSTGGYTLAFPTMKWPYASAGTIGTAASAINTLVVLYDGANYLASLNPSYG